MGVSSYVLIVVDSLTRFTRSGRYVHAPVFVQRSIVYRRICVR